MTATMYKPVRPSDTMKNTLANDNWAPGEYRRLVKMLGEKAREFPGNGWDRLAQSAAAEAQAEAEANKPRLA